MEVASSISLKPFFIGNVEIDPPLVFAPLAEITDIHMRTLIRKIGGVGLVVTEMVSSEGLTRNNTRSFDALTLHPDEHPVAVQIYGGDPDRMAAAAQRAAGSGADIVDINFGCPARKVVKNNKAGAAMMKSLPLAEKITKSVLSAVDIPVTAKFRLGWDSSSVNYLDFAVMAYESGVSALTLHARTKSAGFRGEVDRNAWRKLAEISPVPVIANGDIRTASDVMSALQEFLCSGAMIGRAALANPFVFKQVTDNLNGIEFMPEKADLGGFFKEYYHSLQNNPNRKLVLHRLRTMAGWLSRGFDGGASFRKKISSLKDEETFFTEFLTFFDSNNQEV